jgi:hypothetical protein
MFSKKIVGKLSIVFFVLSLVIIMGMSSCSKQINISDVTDPNQPNNTNTNTNTNTNGSDTNTNTNTNTDPDQTDVTLNNTSVPFLNINLIGGEPPLQKNDGIYYFTQSQHPPSVDSSFRYSTHNGWLVQLDDAALYGYKIKVQSIKKASGNIYDITVRLQAGGDTSKPAFGFFEVKIQDMPTSGQFRVYDDAGKKLWPAY